MIRRELNDWVYEQKAGSGQHLSQTLDNVLFTPTEESSHLSSLALTSPFLELSYTAAATALVHQSYDPAKRRDNQTVKLSAGFLCISHLKNNTTQRLHLTFFSPLVTLSLAGFISGSSRQPSVNLHYPVWTFTPHSYAESGRCSTVQHLVLGAEPFSRLWRKGVQTALCVRLVTCQTYCLAFEKNKIKSSFLVWHSVVINIVALLADCSKCHENLSASIYFLNTEFYISEDKELWHLIWNKYFSIVFFHTPVRQVF